VLERFDATNGSGAGKGKWSPLDRGTLHPLDRETLDMMEQRYGAHGAVLGPEGEVRVTRPGKRAGTSATIGYVGPGVVKMLTSSWPPFVDGKRYDLDELVDNNGDTAAEASAYRSTRLADVEPEEVDWMCPASSRASSNRVGARSRCSLSVSRTDSHTHW
jgi:hypothetical protein